MDLFDPRTAVMDSSDYTIEVGRGDGDFGFAFNDSNFSDRILRIEIISESTEARSDGEGCTSLADWARNRKRRREDIKRENGNSLCFLKVLKSRGRCVFVCVYIYCLLLFSLLMIYMI